MVSLLYPFAIVNYFAPVVYDMTEGNERNNDSC